jgi:pimeloyl-ACP methyl ester carboxylesterase
MAIEQTGTVQRFAFSNNSNTGNVSTTITVPADAEIVIGVVSKYQGTANGLAAMTFTKGGSQVAMTRVGGDSSTSVWQGAIFYLVLPDTGSNKTWAWDWVGTGNSADPENLMVLTFWKGIDTASPVRDSDSVQGNSFPLTTPSLTAQTGDKIVAALAGFASGGGDVSTWTNLTELAELAASDYADISLATGDPTGDTTVAVASVTGYSEGALIALVLKPAAGASAAGPLVGGKLVNNSILLGRLQ